MGPEFDSPSVNRDCLIGSCIHRCPGLRLSLGVDRHVIGVKRFPAAAAVNERVWYARSLPCIVCLALARRSWRDSRRQPVATRRPLSGPSNTLCCICDCLTPFALLGLVTAYTPPVTYVDCPWSAASTIPAGNPAGITFSSTPQVQQPYCNYNVSVNGYDYPSRIKAC